MGRKCAFKTNLSLIDRADTKHWRESKGLSRSQEQGKNKPEITGFWTIAGNNLE